MREITRRLGKTMRVGDSLVILITPEAKILSLKEGDPLYVIVLDNGNLKIERERGVIGGVEKKVGETKLDGNGEAAQSDESQARTGAEGKS